MVSMLTSSFGYSPYILVSFTVCLQEDNENLLLENEKMKNYKDITKILYWRLDVVCLIIKCILDVFYSTALLNFISFKNQVVATATEFLDLTTVPVIHGSRQFLVETRSHIVLQEAK